MACTTEVHVNEIAKEKEWLGDYVIQFLKSPSWTNPIEQFINDNCAVFDLPDPEDNKLEYTGLHNEFKSIIDSLLAAHLLDVDVASDEFAAVFEVCCRTDARLKPIAAQLASVDDFLVFKKMMIDRRESIHHSTFQEQQCSTKHETRVLGAEELGRDRQQQVRMLLSQLSLTRSGVLARSVAAPAEAVSATEDDLSTNPQTPTHSGLKDTKTSQPNDHVELCDDPLPHLPELELAAPPDPSMLRATRIAAIVAHATHSKAENKAKSAMVGIAGTGGAALLKSASRYGA